MQGGLRFEMPLAERSYLGLRDVQGAREVTHKAPTWFECLLDGFKIAA